MKVDPRLQKSGSQEGKGFVRVDMDAVENTHMDSHSGGLCNSGGL